MTHKDDFLSIENENGEYVLNEPIEYHSFVAILRSVSSKNPYKLLDELPEDENVFDTLQLLDYLGLPSFPLPLLRCVNLVRSKSFNNEKQNHRIEYHRAFLPEVRRTAGEFVIALAKNEYKLNDANTRDTVFDLINAILFNAGVFNLRFRDHTLAITKQRCYSLFSKNQRHQLENSHRLPQYEKISSNKFSNTFSWRGVYVPIETNYTDSRSSLSYSSHSGASTLPNRLIWLQNYHTSVFEDYQQYLLSLRNILHRLIRKRQAAEQESEAPSIENFKKMLISQLKPDVRKTEAQSARSGHFNTSPSQIKVDKFKHRCGPKTQKYR